MFDNDSYFMQFCFIGKVLFLENLLIIKLNKNHHYMLVINIIALCQSWLVMHLNLNKNQMSAK